MTSDDALGCPPCRSADAATFADGLSGAGPGGTRQGSIAVAGRGEAVASRRTLYPRTRPLYSSPSVQYTVPLREEQQSVPAAQVSWTLS